MITEVQGTDENIDYDTARHNVTVEVVKEGNSLKATATPEDTATFNAGLTNTQKGNLKITKTVVGGDSSIDTYQAEVKFGDKWVKADGSLSTTKVYVDVPANGSVIIKGLAFGNYDVTEYADGAKITGYQLKVTGEGTATIDKDHLEVEIELTNTYTQDGIIVLGAQKILINRELKAGEFSFVLSKATVDADGKVLTETQIGDAVACDADGKVEFPEIKYTQDDMLDADTNKYTETKTYYYTIKEVVPDPIDKTVIYDSHVELIKVDLVDDQKGTITATPDKNGAQITFTNITVKVSKVDVSDKHEVEGAHIQIFEVKEDGTLEEVFSFTSGKEATEVENLEVGKNYLLHEQTAPYGYKLTEDTTFTVRENGKIDYTGSYAYDEEGNEILLVEDEMKTVFASVRKVWNDDHNRDGLRPIALTIDLLANGEATGKSVTLNQSNSWSATLNDLPMVDAEQKDIVYSWSEREPGNGYKLTGTAVNGTLTTLTNTYVPEKTTMSVQKVWDDDNNAAQKRPASIRVQLFADGKTEGEPVVLSEANSWSYTWNDLALNINTNENSVNVRNIAYSVEELEVPEGYTVEVTPGTKSYVIRNILVPGKLVIEKTFEFTPEELDDTPIDIPVTKNWDDNGNKDGNRPAAITVRLLANNAEVASAELTEATGWKYTFTEMPRYTEAGEPINYTITEDAVAWYEAVINGYNIVNVYKPEVTSATVTKVWHHNGNAQAARPQSIYMTLSNGTVVLLNAENNWTATVENLPTRLNGAPVNYTWTEQTVGGYVLANVTTNGTVTTFTNNYVVTPETGNKKPKTGGDNWAVFEEYDTALGGQLLINHVGDCFD